MNILLIFSAIVNLILIYLVFHYRKIAFTDILGIKNTEAFYAEMQTKKGTLVFIDIDNLKLTNDTREHAIGDELIYTVVNRISKVFRNTDDFYRIGGDEFVLILTEELSIEQITERLESISNISFGVIENFIGKKEQVQEADNLMYEQKRNKK